MVEVQVHIPPIVHLVPDVPGGVPLVPGVLADEGAVLVELDLHVAVVHQAVVALRPSHDGLHRGLASLQASLFLPGGGGGGGVRHGSQAASSSTMKSWPKSRLSLSRLCNHIT